MSLCQQIGRWITDNVVAPLEQLFTALRQQCVEAAEWVEREVRTPIETWRQQEEQRCREQECNWFCLCCNKWFCWVVTILVQVIEWVIQVVGEWVTRIVCGFIVELVRVIVMTLVTVARWIVELVVCGFERACSYLFLLVGLALIALLVSLVLSVAAVGFAVLPGMLVSAGLAGAAILLALRVCDTDRCRLLGVLVWAFKWSVVIGAVAAVTTVNAGSGLVVAIYGGITSALIWELVDRGCRVPALLAQP